LDYKGRGSLPRVWWRCGDAEPQRSIDMVEKRHQLGCGALITNCARCGRSLIGGGRDEGNRVSDLGVPARGSGWGRFDELPVGRLDLHGVR